MKIKIDKLIVILFFYALIFQNLIQNIIPIFKYLDELFVPIAIFYMVYSLITRRKIAKKDMVIYVSLMIVVIIGVLSNIMYNYQKVNAVIGDILIFLKFFAALYVGKIIKEKGYLKEGEILKHAKFIICILGILTIFNYVFKLFPSDMRYGIMSNRLFYSHTTYLAATSIILLGIIIKYDNKIFNMWGIIAIIILFTTLRVKAMGCIVVFILITHFVRKNEKPISIKMLAIIGILVLAVSYNQIVYYFVQNSDFARSILTTKAFEIASDHFPLGTGFGTYASYMSGEYYSPIYYKYGMSNVYGLQETEPSFVSDVFWPMIIGQFGYIGLIAYAVCIYGIYKKIKLSFKKVKIYNYASMLCLFIYLLISSTSESAFVNPMSILFAIFIGYNTTNNILEKEEINEKN